MKTRKHLSRLCVGTLALAFVAGAPLVAEAKKKSDDSSESGGSSKSGRHRFADGFFTGRFRRQGVYSGLTLGVANCMEGRNDTPCKVSVLGRTGETKAGIGLTKEIGYRIPWVFVGASYTFGWLRPDWDFGFQGITAIDKAYQHTLLAVIRPTLPVWRVDLGFEFSPGWSRLVYRGEEWSDKVYSQGLAMGFGVVAAINITQSWIAGIRWTTIRNHHGKVCAKSKDVDKTCMDMDKKKVESINMGLTGIYLSHRW